jgi:hypothetical protein
MILLTERERQQLIDAYHAQKTGKAYKAVEDTIDSLMALHPEAFTTEALNYRQEKLKNQVKYAYRGAEIPRPA